MSVCAVCNKKSRGTDCVNCDICRSAVHVECSGLSRLEVECIRSSTRKIHYYCGKCDIVTAYNTLNSVVTELKNEVLELKTELNILKSERVAIAEPNLELGNHKNLTTEELFSELQERNYRANNLILFNLPENNGQDESTQVRELLLENVTDENIKVISTYRIGKSNTNKARPIRIILSTPQHALNVLRSYKRNGNLYLNKDLTKYQQNASYLTRTEFRKRKEKGENIILKYVNGVPKIMEQIDKKNA